MLCFRGQAMRRKRIARFLATLAAGGMGLECGPSSSPSPCVSGESIACVGPRSCSGYQVCNPNGEGYAPCQCGELPDGATRDSAAGDGASGSGNRDGTTTD